jgi:hypothetical protein
VQITNCDLEMKLRGWVSSAQKRLATPTTTTKPKPPTKCPKTRSPTEKSIFTKPPTGRTDLCVVHLKKGNDKVARSKTRKLLATHVKISEKNLDESSVATKLGNYRILPLAAAAVRRLARKERYAEMSLGCSWWSVKIDKLQDRKCRAVRQQGQMLQHNCSSCNHVGSVSQEVSVQRWY